MQSIQNRPRRRGRTRYELHGHLSEQLFSAIVDYFANFSSSVGSVSEEIYSLQAVYFSYTSKKSPIRVASGRSP